MQEKREVTPASFIADANCGRQDRTGLLAQHFAQNLPKRYKDLLDLLID